MKLLRGNLSVLVLLLILFYLALFASLEYRSDNIDERAQDRWPLASQILDGLSSFLIQVDKRPMPLAGWAPKEASSQVTDLALSLTGKEAEMISEQKSFKEFLSDIAPDGAFNLQEFFTRLKNYQPEKDWSRP